ncbi:MAG TPA: glycosyltransferase family 39 protein [Vicinamibacterales bacterium]|nr:glycosyltransferase family 39 protein [Vicinamibacterales bacterium]
MTPLFSAIQRHPLWVIWLVAAGLRAAYVLFAARSPFVVVDSAEYDTIARALLDGRGLTEAGTAGIRPPLYPLFVAGMYALGGSAALQIAQVVVSATTVVGIAKLGGILHGSRTSWVAGAFAAVYPWFFFSVGGLATETLFTLLVVATFIALLQAAKERRSFLVVISGVTFAAASLVRSNFLIFGPLLFAWWWWQSGRFRQALYFFLGASIALAPFTIYNVLQGNGLAIASSGGGVAFYMGNNPDHTLLYSGELSDEEWRELNSRGIGAAGLAFAGCSAMPCKPVAERDAFFYDAGFRYIATYPGDWAVTTLRKIIRTWQPWVDPLAYSIPMVVLSGASFTALMVLALLGIPRTNRPSRGLMVVLALGITATSVVFLANLRYRFPILDPFLLAAAGSQLHVIVKWMIDARMLPASVLSKRPGVSAVELLIPSSARLDHTAPDQGQR